MQNRTDLAVESFESKEASALSGVKITRTSDTTTVTVLDKRGERALGKPIGSYITLEVNSFVTDNDIFDGRLERFCKILGGVLPSRLDSVLVACLGNKKITADSLGPLTANYVFATRHIAPKTAGFENLFPVSAVVPGVLGDTGIESADIIKGIASQIKPSAVIAVDALAATDASRLATTVQFSDCGISPGSGVGNHRCELSVRTLGVPVVSIGIPTVVGTSVISGNLGDTAFVTPREIDRICEQGAKLIGMGINVFFQKNMDARELFALVG